jgi:acetyl-CoA acetyltransferase
VRSERSGNRLDQVAVAGIHNTRQAKVLDDHDSLRVTLSAARGALADAGITPAEVDAVMGPLAPELIFGLGIGPAMRSFSGLGISTVLEAASLVAAGICRTVLLASGTAGRHRDHGATAPWTRPDHEMTAPFGAYTAVEFALVARRHMHRYGTTPEQLATAAAVVRNNGHANPEATFAGRGPYTAEDVLSSRMVADPFHLLDCSITSEGGCALVLTTAARARDLARPVVRILGGSADVIGPAYCMAPSWDLASPGAVEPAGRVGRQAARAAFATAGLAPADVDVCELYDPFSFEIIRQLETFGFCAEGEGGDFVLDGNIGPGGPLPVSTDGGLLSFSHPGGNTPQLQRVARAVRQLRGDCPTNQVPEASVALVSDGGAAALYTEVLLLGGPS